MEQRISILTIGADDLNAMKNYYEEVLGWTTVADKKYKTDEKKTEL